MIVVESNVGSVQTFYGSWVNLGLLRASFVGKVLAKTTAKGHGPFELLARLHHKAFVDVATKDIMEAADAPSSAGS
jgi:hypothetical protein